jgi:hypothetical protein
LKRTTIVGVAVVFLWLAMMVPHVNALSIACPPTANLSEMTCNVTGNPNEKFGIYLSSVNGFALEPGEVLLLVNSSGNTRFAWDWGGLRWFHPPAEVRFRPYEALQRIVHEFDGPFSGDITWMFLGKVNTFIFTVVYPNGESENFTAEVLFSGRPDWGKILSDYLTPVGLLFGIILLLTLLFVAIAKAIFHILGASQRPAAKVLYLNSVMILLFVLVFSSDFLSAVIFYFVGDTRACL